MYSTRGGTWSYASRSSSPAARATVAESVLGCAGEGRYVRGTPEVADA
jgi:hypothetical protein